MRRLRFNRLIDLQKATLVVVLILWLSVCAPAAATWANGENPGRSSATVLVMDISRSMSKEWQGVVRIDAAKSAAHQVINLLEQENAIGGVHQISLVSFSREAALLQPLTMDLAAARTAVDSLQPQGRTNIYAGLTVALQAMAEAAPTENKIIILLSDGVSNEGPGAAEILAGPVQDAIDAGACIYTVGFGERGDLDEVLLQDIASVSGCGEYNFATDIHELENIYIRIRHQTSGVIIGDFEGQVLQGQSAAAGSFEVPSGQEELAISLWWDAANQLDLTLRDPNGNLHVAGSPGVSIRNYDNLVYVLLAYPKAGRWQVDVAGKTIPTGTAAYSMVVSTRAALHTPTPSEQPATETVPAPAAPISTEPAEPTPEPTPNIPLVTMNPQNGILVLLLTLVCAFGAGIIVFLFLRRGKDSPSAQSLRPEKPASDGIPSLYFTQGPLAGQVFQLDAESISIGRGSANQVQLPDLAVSRLHAIIRYARGAWFLQDQGSKIGCVVNGQRVNAIRLSHGDRFRIGSSEIVFSQDGSEEIAHGG